MTFEMATSPTTKSAPLSGAAKDDVVGLNGDFNFTIADLLDNDPGGAAKVNVTKQFFFGDSTGRWWHPDHRLTGRLPPSARHHRAPQCRPEAFVSFDIRVGATDIKYFVQIGNKGTWSQADVE